MPPEPGDFPHRWGSRESSLGSAGQTRLWGRLPSRAFTLIEILLAVALLGLLSAALVSGAVHLIDGRSQTPQEIFWDAVHAARRQALKSEAEVRLSYDSKEKAFVVDNHGSRKNFPIPDSRELNVDLLRAQPGGGSILVGGQLVDTQTLPSVAFYGDGTCMPFRVQFRTTGPAHVLAIDPWTCAPVLAAKNT